MFCTVNNIHYIYILVSIMIVVRDNYPNKNVCFRTRTFEFLNTQNSLTFKNINNKIYIFY